MGFIIDTPSGFGVEVRSESFVIHGPLPKPLESMKQQYVELDLNLLAPLMAALCEAAARGGNTAIPQPDMQREARRENFQRLLNELKNAGGTVNILKEIASQLEEKL